MILRSMMGCFLVVLLYAATTAFAADTSDVSISQTAYGSVEVGQIGHGWFYNGGGGQPEPITHVWQQRAFGWTGFNARIKERLDMTLTAGGLLAFSSPQEAVAPQTMQTHQIFFLKNAYAAYRFLGEAENPCLKVQVGYFPYKYNPDARNLGEYLFRTNSYPLLVYADFDYPQVDLLGACLHAQTPNKLVQNDLLLHSDLLGFPTQSWSISDIAGTSLFDMISVSVGVSFFHYLSVYQGEYPAMASDRFFNLDGLKNEEKSPFYLRNGADTALFEWRALKTMARFSFDPKKLIPLQIFGKEDLKLYAENDIIGTKNFPQYYTDVNDRMLTVVGFNFPGCKVLDIVNLELEYCPNNSAYSDQYFFGSSNLGGNTIKPVDTSSSNYKLARNTVRWSFYLKKSMLGDHVGFIAQVARDHKKLNAYYWDKQYMSFIETLPTGDDWWWSFKTEFKF